MGILRLHPPAQCELAGKQPRFLDDLFGGGFHTRTTERLGAALIERIVAGGYPAALALRTAARRAAWYRDYVETQVQRDVRDLTRIRSLDALPRLAGRARKRSSGIRRRAALFPQNRSQSASPAIAIRWQRPHPFGLLTRTSCCCMLTQTSGVHRAHEMAFAAMS